jgi:signal peptidase II
MIFFIVIIDQLTKYFAVVYLKNSTPIVLIENFLQLNYVENRGAAFGILQNKQLPLIFFTVVVLIFVTAFLLRNEKLTFLTKITLSGIIGGALGNLIDRVRLNFVVDFIDFNFGGYYDFPVFNIADSFLVLFTILLSILVFLDKYERVDKFE